MTEREVIADVLALMDEGVLSDRSEKFLRPTATVVASARNKDRDEDASRFVKELQDAYPYARLVVSPKSPVEKSAAAMALLLGMPCEILKPGEKGEWDEGATILDERCVARATHVIALDDSARTKDYKKLALRMGKSFSTI